MLKKEFTYTDFDGNQRTEIGYFNMTKVEIAAMQVKMDGKYIDYLQDLVKGNHIEKLFHIFSDLVLDSYGEKSDDGRRFVKNERIREDFKSSMMYSEMMVDMITSPDKMSAFTRSILPTDMVSKAGELNASIVAPVS